MLEVVKYVDTLSSFSSYGKQSVYPGLLLSVLYGFGYDFKSH